jgi:hypothetical protein
MAALLKGFGLRFLEDTRILEVFLKLDTSKCAFW